MTQQTLDPPQLRVTTWGEEWVGNGNTTEVVLGLDSSVPFPSARRGLNESFFNISHEATAGLSVDDPTPATHVAAARAAANALLDGASGPETGRPRVAVLGLRSIGYAIASRLVREGFNVAAYDREPSLGADLEQLGGFRARTARHAAEIVTGARWSPWDSKEAEIRELSGPLRPPSPARRDTRAENGAHCNAAPPGDPARPSLNGGRRSASPQGGPAGDSPVDRSERPPPRPPGKTKGAIASTSESATPQKRRYPAVRPRESPPPLTATAPPPSGHAPRPRPGPASLRRPAPRACDPAPPQPRRPHRLHRLASTQVLVTTADSEDSLMEVVNSLFLESRVPASDRAVDRRLFLRGEKRGGPAEPGAHATDPPGRLPQQRGEQQQRRAAGPHPRHAPRGPRRRRPPQLLPDAPRRHRLRRLRVP